METVKTGWLEKKSVMRARVELVELSWGAKVDVLPGAGSRFQVILAKHALKCGAADDAARDAWMRALRSEASHAVRSATVQFAGEAWQIDPKYELVKKPNRRDREKSRERFEGTPSTRSGSCGEVRLMRNWNHPCVLGLYDIVEPSHSADFEDLYIVTPLSTTDLSRVIYSKTALSSDQQLYLFYQTLCGVHYINSAGVIHRDLKPANLLVDVKTCGLKVMLGFHHYGAAIDVWASACIFVEMLIKEPLFPGNDYLHQLKIILKQLGKPTDPATRGSSRTNPRQFLDGLPAYAAQPLDRKVPGAPPGRWTWCWACSASTCVEINHDAEELAEHVTIDHAATPMDQSPR
ncbi:MAP kinase [Aureococcus anophagefferens]|uniref:MAP kinase n=1 Tax=Aureococcus anophagefferens TaxID=44056 RepID=A0ABR1GCJ5_AURAN